MLPAQDKELLLRRLTNLKTLGLLSGPEAIACLGVTEDRIVEAISRDEETVVSERYLLHKQSFYEDLPDEASVEMCSTLEEVEGEIVEHLKEESVQGGYGFFVEVYDLNLGRKLGYELVRTVKWT